MRAVDGDDGHGAIAFDKHGIGVGHGGRSLRFFRERSLAPSTTSMQQER
jgi:hypothetical protein